VAELDALSGPSIVYEGAREADMKWDAPELIEINMSAEIGAYQEDFEERGDMPAFAAAELTPDDGPQASK
jgi:hypothetical protein